MLIPHDTWTMRGRSTLDNGFHTRTMHVAVYSFGSNRYSLCRLYAAAIGSPAFLFFIRLASFQSLRHPSQWLSSRHHVPPASDLYLGEVERLEAYLRHTSDMPLRRASSDLPAYILSQPLFLHVSITHIRLQSSPSLPHTTTTLVAKLDAGGGGWLLKCISSLPSILVSSLP